MLASVFSLFAIFFMQLWGLSLVTFFNTFTDLFPGFIQNSVTISPYRVANFRSGLLLLYRFIHH
jgi:hypothetical protein